MTDLEKIIDALAQFIFLGVEPVTSRHYGRLKNSTQASW
jgi:hypothetical protein